MAEFDLKRLTGTLGAVVTGIDLAQSLAPSVVEALKRALFEHLVLVFPGQGIEDADQYRLVSHLGEPYIHPLGRLMGKAEALVERIVDSSESRPYQDRWHTDVSFDASPPTVGSLRAIDIPAVGGDTLWASTRDAYDALPDALRERIKGMRAVHNSGAGEAFIEKIGREFTERLQAAYPGTEHEIVQRHPVTGRRHLYVNRQFTRRIVGLDPDESEALLETLYRHIENPNLQVRHRWTEGDVGLWDERATWHFAVADHYPQRREMARMIVSSSGAPGGAK
jgi:taurine dioxygenase